MSEKEAIAFEFVLGTLSIEERQAFLSQLETDAELAKSLAFWEDQLHVLNTVNSTLEPKPQTWQAIQDKINPHSAKERAAKNKPRLLSWLPWGLSLVMSFVLVVVLSFGQFNLGKPAFAPIDYVAVLTDENGAAKLTAVTEGRDQTMWLQWEGVDVSQDQDLQIWAQSKTDQEIRSIAVVADRKKRHLRLSDAEWRLIKDADSLILTIEEKGGSVLDEPSDMIVAKGICVRLDSKDKDS